MSIPVPPLDWPHYGIGLVPALKRGFQKYATFSGRASRSEYWYWVLANLIVYLVLYGLTIGLGLATRGSSNDFGPGGVAPLVLLIVWIFGTIVPNIAIAVRRLHDAGYSGLYYLLSFIPYLGSLIVMVFCALQTSPAAAKYGPPYPAYGYQPHGGYAQQPSAGQVYGQPGYEQTYGDQSYGEPSRDDQRTRGIDPR
jgi:uncharacterized membrane protein YhaH (DUF805 family)